VLAFLRRAAADRLLEAESFSELVAEPTRLPLVTPSPRREGGEELRRLTLAKFLVSRREIDLAVFQRG